MLALQKKPTGKRTCFAVTVPNGEFSKGNVGNGKLTWAGTGTVPDLGKIVQIRKTKDYFLMKPTEGETKLLKTFQISM